MSKRWLVFDVGCIECGEISQPVGTYDTKEEAEQARKEYLNDPDGDWGRESWSGQHSVEIFDLDNVKIGDDPWGKGGKE